jgi:hypothetical protein
MWESSLSGKEALRLALLLTVETRGDRITHISPDLSECSEWSMELCLVHWDKTQSIVLS